MSTYWVDANVLVRFLTGEPPEMADRAERLLEKAQRGETSLKIHPVVVAETVWVLQSFYGHSGREIASTFIPLLTEHGLRVESSGIVVRALEGMAENNVDFADALLAETARSRGEGVASFDEDFRKLNIEFHEPD
ncbi:tRNA(fMet)-specific endonuclease VapC [Rubrobacter xylanophilus DSM 9941]|uniref:PIN domain-containing protein n=1 Tax=Rubrobacter xylanophilus TaxID=49319 RepID=UPI001C6432F3|nr:type II toxin-antitoxin system VapC family toxin [Rubrobacter xylanophilus]QYJ15924.1 tRNA(fMet)-specific endonuclease VapC [Rubrobacter xylanophilus DSM 9941]